MAIFYLGCASKAPQVDIAKLQENKEFEERVKIIIPEEAPLVPSNAELGESVQSQKPEVKKSAAAKKKEKKSDKKSSKSAESQAQASVPEKRQPELESSIGFDGRRPIKDPFRVGERMTFDVTYFKVSAGTLNLEVKPFAMVNGSRSYNFQTSIKTSSLFSSFYSVDDKVTTLVDYDTLVPSVFTLHVNESGQIKEARCFFDTSKNQATYWEKKVTKKDGEEEKKIEWEILPYSQNVFSAIFYMRAFQWDVGKENAFRIANNGDNLVFKGKAIRREKLKTDVGEFNTLVIKMEFELKNQFHPTGDNLVWITDDDRKFVVRIESKIKIGTLTAALKELVRGN